MHIKACASEFSLLSILFVPKTNAKTTTFWWRIRNKESRTPYFQQQHVADTIHLPEFDHHMVAIAMISDHYITPCACRNDCSCGLRPGSNTCFSENTIFYLNCTSCYRNKMKHGNVLGIAKFYRFLFKNLMFIEKCAKTHA